MRVRTSGYMDQVGQSLIPPTLIGQLLDPGPFLLRDPQCVRGWGDMTSLLEFIKKFFCQVLIILGHLVSILVTVPSRKKSCSCCCYLFHFFTCGGSRYTCGGGWGWWRRGALRGRERHITIIVDSWEAWPRTISVHQTVSHHLREAIHRDGRKSWGLRVISIG